MSRIVDQDGVLIGEEFSEQRLVGLLAGLYELRRNADAQRTAYDLAKKPVGDFLLGQAEGYRLKDGEAGVYAQYQGGGQEQLLDFGRLLDSGADGGRVLYWLARHGCLALRWPVFKALAKSAPEQAVAERFIYTEPRTRRLVIDREKE